MITLRRLLNKDAEGMLEWLNDKDISRHFSFDDQSHNIESVQSFIRNSMLDEQSLHLAIVDEYDTYLGTISLKNIDGVNLHAEYAIALRKSSQGKGVGYQASKLLIAKAKQEFNLHKIYLNVLVTNQAAIQLYEKLGFEQRGFFKDHLLKGDQFRDLYYYELMLSEVNL